MFVTIIAGSRGLSDEQLVRDALDECGWREQITHILHGDATGIDRTAGHVCEGMWPVIKMPAEWSAHGRAAGIIRNKAMAQRAQGCIAIWNGKSRGTKHMIDEAKKRGLKVYVKMVTS